MGNLEIGNKKNYIYYNVNKGNYQELQAWLREEWSPLLLKVSGLLLTLVVNPCHLVSSWAFIRRESESLSLARCIGMGEFSARAATAGQDVELSTGF